jgi:hypothetical protein
MFLVQNEDHYQPNVPVPFGAIVRFRGPTPFNDLYDHYILEVPEVKYRPIGKRQGVSR